MSTYMTAQGDTWDLIAYTVLGAEKYMKDLIEANLHLSHTLVFSAGTELVIPDIPETRTDDLPFWHSDDNSIWLEEA